MLCKSCSGKQCRNLSTEDNPIDIECPSCNGFGCELCDDGYVRLDGCPNQMCAPVVPVIDIIDMIGKGHLPIAGGTLDQSVSIIQAARWFESEENKVRNEQFSRHPD